jgi:hypothetical protein
MKTEPKWPVKPLGGGAGASSKLNVVARVAPPSPVSNGYHFDRALEIPARWRAIARSSRAGELIGPLSDL